MKIFTKYRNRVINIWKKFKSFILFSAALASIVAAIIPTIIYREELATFFTPIVNDIWNYLFVESIEIVMILFIILIIFSIILLLLLVYLLKNIVFHKKGYWQIFNRYFDSENNIDWKITYTGKQLEDIVPYCSECKVPISHRSSKFGRKVYHIYRCDNCNTELKISSQFEDNKKKIFLKIQSMINKNDWKDYVKMK